MNTISYGSHYDESDQDNITETTDNVSKSGYDKPIKRTHL